MKRKLFLLAFILAVSVSSAFAQCHVIAVNRPEEFKPGQSLSLSVSQLPEISITEYQPVENIRQTLLQRIQEELQSTKYFSSVIGLKPAEKPQTDLLFQAEITLVEKGFPAVILTQDARPTGFELHIALVSIKSNRNILELECLGTQMAGFRNKPREMLAQSINNLIKNLRETLSGLPKEIQSQSGSALKPILATTEIAESEDDDHLMELNNWLPWNYSRIRLGDLLNTAPPSKSIEKKAAGLHLSAASAKSADETITADIVTSISAPLLIFNYHRLLNLRYMLYGVYRLKNTYGERYEYIWRGFYNSDRLASPVLTPEYISADKLSDEIDSTNTIAVWIRYDKRSLTFWNIDRISEATTLTSSAHPKSVVKPLRVYNLTGQVSERRVKKVTKASLIYRVPAAEVHINNSALLIFPKKNQEGSLIIDSFKGNLEIHTELDGHQVTIKIDLGKLDLDSVDQIYNRKPN